MIEVLLPMEKRAPIPIAEHLISTSVTILIQNFRQMASNRNRQVGRPRTFDPATVARILALGQAGLGTRAIVARLLDDGVWASRGSVRRVISGESPYDEFSDN